MDTLEERVILMRKNPQSLVSWYGIIGGINHLMKFQNWSNIWSGLDYSELFWTVLNWNYHWNNHHCNVYFGSYKILCWRIVVYIWRIREICLTSLLRKVKVDSTDIIRKVKVGSTDIIIGDDHNLSNSRACTARMLVIISVTAPRITCNCLQKGFQLVFSKTAFSETVFSQSEDGQKGVWGCRPYSGPTDLM